MDQWTIVATMQDGTAIAERTTSRRRFALLWVGFADDPDCRRVVWSCRALERRRGQRAA